MGISYTTKINETRSSKLVDKLRRVDNKIDKIVREIATTSETSNLYWTNVNRRLRDAYNEAKYITTTWAAKELPKTYREEQKSDITKVNSKKVKPLKHITIKDAINSDFTAQAVQAIVGEANASFITGFDSGQKTFLQLTRATQQVNLSEKQLNRSIEQGFIEKGSVQGSKKALQQKLLKKAIDGKYITVINKNGVPMQFGIKHYAELVARTKLQEAAAQATINTAQAVGSDLVQVSSHNTTTPICQHYEGKIFSLTGNDADFPVLDASPPFHVNCKHSLTVVIKDALEINGTLEKYIDFSNGETDTHPTLTKFIPVSQRPKV